MELKNIHLSDIGALKKLSSSFNSNKWDFYTNLSSV